MRSRSALGAKLTAIFVLYSLFTLISPVLLSSQDLFSEVFGTVEEQELSLPVVRHGIQLGEVRGRVSGSLVTFHIGDFIAVTEAILSAPVVTELAALARTSSEGFVEVGSLTPLGISTVYRSERVELEIEIAPERLREQFLNRATGPVLENVQEEQRIAGYVNLFSRGALSSVAGQNTLQAEFEPVISVQSWVLESSFSLRSGSTLTQEGPATLNALRVVRDLPEEQIRIEAGTPRYIAGSLAVLPEIVGISATRRDELREDQPLSQEGRIRFVAPRRGMVELMLNGRPYRTYSVQEGPHTILDLPLGRGSNQVAVTQPTADGTGVVTLSDVRIPFAPGLLVPGRHRFSYGAGVLREQPGTPFVSGLHRIGIIPELTAGAFLQATSSRLVAGGELLGAGEWGVTSVSTAFSVPDGVGFAGELSHIIALLHSRWLPTVELIASGQNGAFRSVANPIAGGTFRIGAFYSQRLPGAVTIGLGALQRWRFDPDEPGETQVRLTASHQSVNGFSLNAQIGPTIVGSDVDWQGGIFIRFSDPARAINTSASYDVANGPASLSVTAIPDRSVETWRWSARYQGFDRSPGQPQTLQGTVGYDAYRYSASLEPSVRETIGVTEGEYRLGAQFSSAVAFAGRAVAVSRPIRDSFVLVTPREQIAPYRVPIRGGGGAVVAVVTGRATVIPDLRSYRGTTIVADGSYLPDGLSLGGGRYSFVPRYRSGYQLTIGSEASVYVRGRLVDGGDRPIGLEAGEVIASDGTSTTFFTNQEGEFEILELTPGEYRLLLYSDPESETVLAIPPDVVGRYDLEDVVFLREEL